MSSGVRRTTAKPTSALYFNFSNSERPAIEGYERRARKAISLLVGLSRQVACSTSKAVAIAAETLHSRACTSSASSQSQ